MPECEDLEVQRGTRPDKASEHRQNENQHRHHCDQSLPVTIGKFNMANRYGVLGRHRIEKRVTSDETSVADRNSDQLTIL
jgi:hypothetical protein